MLNLRAGYEGVEAELSQDEDEGSDPFGVDEEEGPRFDKEDLVRLKVRHAPEHQPMAHPPTARRARPRFSHARGLR